MIPLVDLRLATLATALVGGMAAPAPAPTPAPGQQQPTTVILVRHAEKIDDSDDPALSAEGERRAQELARVLTDVHLDAVLSTPFIRTRETARPVAERVGLPVLETPVTPTLVADIAERILGEHRGQTVLVVGHSNTTPGVIEALGVENVLPMEDDEYDDLFVVTVAADGTAAMTQLHYGPPSP